MRCGQIFSVGNNANQAMAKTGNTATRHKKMVPARQKPVPDKNEADDIEVFNTGHQRGYKRANPLREDWVLGAFIRHRQLDQPFSRLRCDYQQFGLDQLNPA